MWLYGFIGCPPRHITIAPASVGVPQANSGKTLRKSTCKGFWLWLAERKLHPLGAMLRQQSGPSIAQGSRVWCRTCTLRAKTTKHSYTRAWAWVMISSSPTKKPFPDGYAQTQCGTSRYRFPNPRRRLQTTSGEIDRHEARLRPAQAIEQLALIGKRLTQGVRDRYI